MLQLNLGLFYVCQCSAPHLMSDWDCQSCLLAPGTFPWSTLSLTSSSHRRHVDGTVWFDCTQSSKFCSKNDCLSCMLHGRLNMLHSEFLWGIGTTAPWEIPQRTWRLQRNTIGTCKSATPSSPWFQCRTRCFDDRVCINTEVQDVYYTFACLRGDCLGTRPLLHRLPHLLSNSTFANTELSLLWVCHHHCLVIHTKANHSH